MQIQRLRPGAGKRQQAENRERADEGMPRHAHRPYFQVTLGLRIQLMSPVTIPSPERKRPRSSGSQISTFDPSADAGQSSDASALCPSKRAAKVDRSPSSSAIYG